MAEKIFPSLRFEKIFRILIRYKHYLEFFCGMNFRPPYRLASFLVFCNFQKFAKINFRPTGAVRVQRDARVHVWNFVSAFPFVLKIYFFTRIFCSRALLSFSLPSSGLFVRLSFDLLVLVRFVLVKNLFKILFAVV